MKAALAGQIHAMKEFFDRSTKVLTEADSGYSPQPGMFTVAATVAHVAQTVEWFMEGAFSESGFSMDFEKMDGEVRQVTSLTEARAWLDKACAAALKTTDEHAEGDWLARLPDGPIMAGQPRMAIFGAITDHSAHHRGALTVYTRLLGRVPPMPYMDM